MVVGIPTVVRGTWRTCVRAHKNAAPAPPLGGRQAKGWNPGRETPFRAEPPLALTHGASAATPANREAATA
jgi:hypothetical protein